MTDYEVSFENHMRKRVERLEGIVQQLPQVECPVSHHFKPGSYARTMVAPAHVAATGAAHKTEHWTFVLGHCFLTTDEGVREFVGAHAFLSKPGTKRAIVTVKRTVVMTVHHTDTTDLNALVEELTESRASELLGGSENKQALAQKRKGEIE